MRVPSLLIAALLLSHVFPAEAVCNLCVFPVLAAAGTSALSGAAYSWLTWMWAGAGTELLILYLAGKASDKIFHLDLSVPAQCVTVSLMYFYGYKGLYAAAGVALVHIVLVIHCIIRIIRSCRKIPYLRTLLINTTLVAAGLLPLTLPDNTAQTAVAYVSYVLLFLHGGLYLLRSGLRYRYAE